MKTLINKYLQIRTTPPFQIIITNQTTLLLMALFLLFIQTTQAKTKLTGNFLLNNTISSIPLEREENNLYNNKSEKEGDVTSITNNSKNTSKNSTFREVANDDFKNIEEGSNTTQFYYILEQNFKNAISLENIAVANQPFPNPDTDGDGITDDIDVDDDNDGILDTVENGYEEYCIDNNYNSGYYEYIVPSGVSNLSVTLQGGKGGNGGNDIYNAPQVPQGAIGQILKSTITVIPGSTLEIYVGGDGIDGIQSNQGSYTSQGGTNLLGGLFNGGRGGRASTNGGWSGHGGGGGAATVMRVPQSNGTFIEYVAAGGGGGGGQGASSNGTDGGLCSNVSSGSGNGANDPNDGGGGGGGGGGLLRGNGGAVDEPGDRGADGGCNGSNYFPGSSVVTALSGTKVSICIVDIDKDNDGLISSLDLDSDGDGIPDNIEAQSTADYTVPASDNAATYTTNNGLNSSYITSNGITPIDTDGDGLPDFIDLDSDNAQTDDTTEAGLTVSNNDSDNDGLDNNNDSNNSVYGPANAGITDPLITYEDNGQDINSRAACENGTIIKEQYVISATGNANTGWGQNDGVIGAPDETGSGTTANRISLRGINAPITLTYQDTFTGGATITFYGRHWNGSYVDGFTIAFSEDNSTWTSESSSQNIGSTSYTTLNYTIPNNFSGNYKYIRLTSDDVGPNSTLSLFDAVKVTSELCILYEGRVFEDSGTGAGGIFGDCIENGDENSLNLPDGLYANVVQGSTLVYSSLLDSSGNYQIPHLEDGNYEIVITTDPLSTSVSLPKLYSFGANGWYFISVVNDVVTSPSSIPTICIQSCEFGKITEEQYVIAATGNHSGSWGTDNGVIGAPDETGSGTTANRISLHRNLVTLTYQDIFSGGAVITMYARHWSGSYTGGFTMAFSEDNSTWTSESSSQNIGSASYTTLNYTVPNNLNGNYKYIRLTYDNVGGNTLTLIDAVKVAYEVCNDCPTGVDAPVLSATTITNSCPTQTMDLTSITASNQPANTTLTWHTGVPATDANKVSAPATAVAGIYYASFYSFTSQCYTLDGEAVTAVTADGDSDCDGVSNATDIDDDNDGVLDTVESYDSNSTVYTTNIQTDNTWKKSTVENATEGSSFNGVSFGDIPDSATFTENVTIGNPANGTITGVDKIVAPLNKQTYYRKTFTLSDISNFNEAIIKASRDNSCQIFINGNDVARTNAATGVGAIFGLKINESGANQNGYNHTAFATFTSDNANDIFVEGENEIIFVLDDSGGSAGLSLDLDLSYYQTVFIDTDGDGIPNSLDLDSDGDGCSDALEAGATTNTTANYVFTGAVGTNGLVDTLETTADSGTINYTSTYYPYAVSDFLAGCVDTDSDGINDLLDIDDDNDGILDATESPSCFYLANEFENGDRTEFVEVTTTLSMNATYNDLNETVDGVNGTGSADYAVRFNNSQSAIDQTVYQFEFQQAVELSTIYIGYINGNSHFINGASIKLQASNNNATWLDVNDGATYNQTNSNSNVPSVGTIRNQAFEVTKNAGVYKYYRIQGVSGTIWDGGYSNEIYFETNNFNASLYPKGNCSVDTDNDGTYNHLDTDSDGDGCIDTTEANAQDDGDTGDANNNGLLDKYEDGTTGTISYSSTYGLALDDNANTCADTDGDGIGDLIDLDDDNDGILDIDEQVANNCQYLGTTTDFNGYTFNNDAKVAVTAVSQNSITVNRLSGSWVSAYSNKTYSLPMRLSFTVDNVNSASMIGLIGTSQNKDFTDWSKKSHLFYFINGASYDIRDIGTTRTGGSYASGDEFIIDIDSSGNLVMTQNGEEKWTDTVTDTEFQFVLSTASTTPKPYNNIFLNDGVDNLPYGCTDIDTDGDTIPNRLDLDSDGDGCNDSIEGVSPIPASPWSPAEITTSVWLDAADASTITADGNGVSKWDDKSGNDHHAVQTNNTYKPTYALSDLDGKDGIDFYLNKSLRKATGTQTVGYVIAILKAENATWNNYHAIFGHRANSRFGGFMQSGNTGFHNNAYPGSVWVDGTSKTVSTSGFSTIDSPHIWSYTPSGNTVKSLTNGYSMGNYDNGNGGGSATHYEVVVLPTIPTDQERQILEGYLAHKWDLAANLPDGHPYKNAAPESTIVGGGSGATCNIFTKPSNNSTSVYNTGDDTNNNGLLDAFEGAEAGTTNYTSRYVAYALDNTINACTDSDGDDVGDIFDLDDDNDGVLDTTEGTGDTDGDGTPNHLDTDSDNDGCLDTIEAGTTNNGATTDANCNGLLDQYEDGVTNTINYTSTYNPYALNNTVNSCVDTDSDGVNDVFDLDDDNDGVLDTEEGCQILAYDLTTLTWDTAAAMTVTTANSSTLQGTSTSSWKSALSTQTFSLPLDISFTYSETTREVMVGFAEEDSDLGTSWNTATAFGFYIYNTNTRARYNNTNGGTVTSNSNGKTHRIVIDAAGNLTTYIDGQLTYQQTGLSTDQYKVYIAHNSSTNKPLENVALRTANYPLSCELDTDGDGTPNGLDLDSDGDGCSDALEAGATTNTTANYVFTGAVGTNGLVDTLETSVDSGIINYTSTYNPNAVSDFLAGCVDTDSDGVNDLLDIDDDNDGILDATESPSCFYLANEFENGDRTEFVEVTTTLSMNATYNDLNETVDGVNGTGSADYAVRFNNSQSAIDQTVYQFEFQQAVELSTIYIGYINGNSHFINGASIKLQASNNNATWLDVNDGATYNQANSNSNVPSVGTIRNQAFEVTKNAGVYKYYRIQGVSGTIWDGGYSNEIYFETNNFNASLYPKGNCSVDTDNDGTYNHLDTDSDGDTCIDTIEAGTSNDGTTTDVNNNGLLDQYEDGTTGTINYTSTYSAYAINDTINACADTDGDGVNDLLDIDDDNDGILDTVELNAVDDGNFDSSNTTYSDPQGITMTGENYQWSTYLFQSATNSNYTQVISKTMNGLETGDSFTLSVKKIGSSTGVNANEVSRIKIEVGNLTLYDDTYGNFASTYGNGWNAVGEVGDISFTDTSLSSNPIFKLTITKNNNSYNIDPVITSFEYVYIVRSDTDGDGTPNSLDLDSDNDGILDNIEAQNYSSYIAPSGIGSGITDINGNGLDDVYESTPGVGLTPVNSDTDSLENFVDIDADNDGIPDNVELQRTKLYIAPSGIATSITDVNSNGVDDNYEIGGTVGIIPVDTELDGIPDYVDTDTDNDGLLDIAENGNSNNVTSGTDTDNDGLDDNFDNYDDTNISGHTVNNGINPPSASNLGDSDNDLATGGDVDFRDNVNTILITQVYQSAGKKMIEVTNIGAGQIPGGTFTLNLFSNNSGDMTGLTPSASYTITSTLNANQSIVIENNAGGGFSNINSGAISITDDTITNFSDGNDILVLSTTSDNTSWTNRLDVIHSVNNITSIVLKDNESNPVAANNPDRWSVFIDDNLDPYRPDTVGGAERHPHDPLMSEILNASENSNMQLGYHRSGETVRIAGAWNNGIPDRSRRVIINEDYLHNDGSHLSARQLTIDNNSKLTIQDKLLIVSDLVTITGINDEIRLAGSRSQLITTHSRNSGINGNGKLYVDQNSDIPSTYRYNYFSSPVTTVGQNTFSVASVMKDGSIATSSDSNAMDMNWTNDMNGSPTSPITIADYWIYSFGSSGNWSQLRKDGQLLPANGFTLKGPGQEQNYTFEGTPNDGLIKTTVSPNTSYLVGNPYPSAIDSKKFLEDNSESIYGTIYFWEHHPGLTEENDEGHYSSNYIGGYATRNLTMGIAAPNNGDGNIIFRVPGKYISIAQGFFITGSNTGGEVVFKNSQREYRYEGDDSIFFRDGENSEVSETYQDPVLKIGLDFTNSNNQQLHRQVGVSFNENRSFSFDLGYDSPLYEPLENDIQYRVEETKMFWKFEEDDTKYVIAGIQEFSTDIEIPIGFSLEYDGEIIVKLDEQQNFEQDVYLKDKLTGATYKLSDNEQGVAITLSTGSHLDKYAIVFVESSLNTDDDMLLENQLGVYVDNMANELVLKNYQNLDIKKVGLYNILGQTIKTWDNLGTDTEYRKGVQLPAAIYVVRITTENGEFVKKIRVD